MAGNGKAKAKMERYETIASPVGTAGFSFLREPDEKFGAKHRIQIFVDVKSAEAKAFASKLLATQAEYCKKIGKPDPKKVPGLKKADAYMADRFGKFGVKEGDLYWEFNSNARKVDGTDDWKFIPIYDVANQPTEDVRVFGGDVVRVSVTLMGYTTGKEYGIKAYLNAVQMLVKKSGGGAASNPFADESANFQSEAEATEEPADLTGFQAEEPTEEPVEEKPATKTSKKEKAAAPKAEPAATGEVSLEDLV